MSVGTRPDTEPCARIDRQRRFLPTPALDGTPPEALAQCVRTDEGAVGVVAKSETQEAITFVVSLERNDGTSAVSEPFTTRKANLRLGLVVLSHSGARSFVMLRLADALLPVPFGPKAPVETNAFFAEALGGSPTANYPWVAVAVDAEGFQLDFEMPELRWHEPIPYGGQRDSTLHGVRSRLALDSSLRPRAEGEPLASVRRACLGTPTVSKASGEDLWAAAQCARLGGLEVSRVLEQVKARCSALAARALPLILAAARADSRARDGLAPEGAPRPPRDALARATPPSSCFAEMDRMWDIDYTARASPFRVPPVALDPVWESSLRRGTR